MIKVKGIKEYNEFTVTVCSSGFKIFSVVLIYTRAAEVPTYFFLKIMANFVLFVSYFIIPSYIPLLLLKSPMHAVSNESSESSSVISWASVVNSGKNLQRISIWELENSSISNLKAPIREEGIFEAEYLK